MIVATGGSILSVENCIRRKIQIKYIFFCLKSKNIFFSNKE